MNIEMNQQTKKYIIIGAVALLIILLIALLIALFRPPQIKPTTFVTQITPTSTKLAEALQTNNAVDDQIVWQVTGTELVGYRRDSGEVAFRQKIPIEFSNSTTLVSVSNTVILRNHDDNPLHAIALPKSNEVTVLPENTVAAIPITADMVVSWRKNNETTDELVRLNSRGQLQQVLSSTERAFNAQLWRLSEDKILVFPEYATDTQNQDVFIYDLVNNRQTTVYQKIGYSFAVNQSGTGIYYTAYTDDLRSESYFLNISANTKTKLPRVIFPSPSSAGTNDVLYTVAPNNGQFDIVALKNATVKVVTPEPLPSVMSFISQTADTLLVITETGPQTITIK